MKMKYAFTAYGHHNILATHRATLEITKDAGLTEKGDCVVSVNADFSLQRIKEVLAAAMGNSGGGKIRLTLGLDGSKEEITAVANPNFSSDREIVLRKGSFLSERTLGVHADKAAADLSSELVTKLENQAAVVAVVIEAIG